MGFAQSVDDDILMAADNDPRSVVLYRRASDDTFAAGVEIEGVVREDLRTGTTGNGGAILPSGSAAFHLQASQVGAAPSPGDRIKDVGTGRHYDLDTADVRAEGTLYYVVGVPTVGGVIMMAARRPALFAAPYVVHAGHEGVTDG